MIKPLALIIEDDPDISIVFGEALRSAGFETEAVTMGKEALARLEASTPDIVVLDMNLPQVSGDTLLDKIRSDPRLGKTRIIVATADAQAADLIQARADLVLLKPISFTQLRDLAIRLKSL